MTIASITQWNKEIILSFKGRVVKGRQIGRQIGFPTANLEFNDDKVSLDKGVYGVMVSYNDESYLGVMNVGVRPTFKQEKGEIHYEIHLLDFESEIYDETLNVDVCFFVRGENSYSTIDDLTFQIKKDVEYVEKRFRLLKKKDESIHLADLPFSKLIEQIYGINRGVYNTIDTMFYEKGIQNILKRRIHILSFVEFIYNISSSKTKSRVIFGSGGLKAKFDEYCNHVVANKYRRIKP